jgi:hypothetical protein
LCLLLVLPAYIRRVFINSVNHQYFQHITLLYLFAILLKAHKDRHL